MANFSRSPEMTTWNTEMTTWNTEMTTWNTEMTTWNTEMTTWNTEMTTWNTEMTTWNTEMTTWNTDLSILHSTDVPNSTASNITHAQEESTTTESAALMDQGMISASWYMAFLDPHMKVTVAVCGLSVVFCVLNAQVYWGQRKGAFAVYIMGVSVCDGLYALLDFVVNVSRFMVAFDSWWGIHSTWYLNIYLGTSVRRAAICLNALASLERFFAIAFPLKTTGTGIFSLAPARTTLGVIVCSCVAHMYLMFEWKVQNVAPDQWNAVPTALKRSNPESFEVGKNAVRALTFFLPLGVSLLLNLALVIALRTHFANRRAIRTSSGKNGQGNPEGQRSKACNSNAETQTTKLILAFSFTFVLLALPRAANTTLATYVDGYGIFKQEHYLYQTVTKLTQLLTHATEVALFFVCFVYSRRFRQALQRMACVRMCRKLLRKSRGPSRTTGETDTDGNTGSFDNITETQNDTVDDSV